MGSNHERNIMWISEHISYREAVRSDTAKRMGLDNVPSAEQLKRITTLCKKVFEPLREYTGTPIYISSCFRSPALNKIIGGAKNSQHLANNGAAFDLDAQVFGGTTNREIGDYIRKNLEFDQLIYEDWDSEFGDYAWIHCSYNEKNRNEVLVMKRINGKVGYERY